MSKQMLFSDHNHWRFGWDKGTYNFEKQTQKLWVSFGPCRRAVKSFDFEIAAAARRIAENTTKPIYVAMSGGIDSELVARILIQEKIRFVPVIVQFDHDYNKQDISYAFDFCKLHNLNPEIIQLDIVDFFEKSVTTPYILANCAHLMQMHIMRHVARLGGMAIIAVGEQRYMNYANTVHVPVPIERIAVTHFMQAEQIEGVSAFYCYTPEMMLSLLNDAQAIGFDTIDEFAHNIKEQIYHTYWPDLTPRPKYSGFEHVAAHRSQAQKKLRERFGTISTKQFLISVEALERQLTGDTETAS